MHLFNQLFENISPQEKSDYLLKLLKKKPKLKNAFMEQFNYKLEEIRLHGYLPINIEELINEIKEEANNWKQIIDKVPHEKLKEFIIEYAENDKAFRDQLKINFAEYDGAGNPEKYRKMIQDSFRRAEDRHGYIKYDDISTALRAVDDLLAKAGKYIETGNFAAAFAMLSPIAPECIKGVESAYDSETEFTDPVTEAFQSIAVIFEKCNDEKLKETIFKYLLKEAENPIYSSYGCADDVEQPLIYLAVNEQQKQLVHQFIGKKIEKANSDEGWSKEYELKKYLQYKANLLKAEGNTEDAKKIIIDNLHISDFRQKIVDAKLEEGKTAEAIKLILEGIEIAKKDKHPGTESNWKEQLLTIYTAQKDTENIRKRALELYFENRYNFKYYRIYKATWVTTQWPNERAQIIKAIIKNSGNSYSVQKFNNNLANLYVEEKMVDKLYEMVEKYPMINILISYAKYLKDNYSPQLLKFFKSAVEWYLEQNTGRNAYRTAIDYLKEMKRLKDGDIMVSQMVDNFKIQYKNRPAMFDEFRSAGFL
ncbi:MAG: hypothetical protein P1P88_00465 [Bacteroidales bacterium]|nr:hypothetical protein [Bacteroidales bacterium]